MEKGTVKIFFFGSGAFAVPVLEALCLNTKIRMCGIITQPDKPAGRRMTLTPTPVGKWCESHSIECRKACSVNEPAFLESLKAEQPDMIVVVSFGQILKEPILELPRLCCLNVHASLLPKYRGASPITSAVLNGDLESGVCFMQMDKGLDTGAVYETHRITLAPDIRTDVLENQLATLAARKIVNCISSIAENHLAAVPQNHAEATVSKKIRKSDGAMRWGDSAVAIERRIRAFYPWPSVCFLLPTQNRNVHVKITSGKSVPALCTDSPGKVLKIAPDGITVSCGIGALLIERVIPEGKKEMTAADFARGLRLGTDTVFADGPAVPLKS